MNQSGDDKEEDMRPEYDIGGGVRGKYYGQSRGAGPPHQKDIDQAIEEFVQENPDVMEALEVFGIAVSEYERALSALNPAATYTGSSTQPLR